MNEIIRTYLVVIIVRDSPETIDVFYVKCNFQDLDKDIRLCTW